MGASDGGEHHTDLAAGSEQKERQEFWKEEASEWGFVLGETHAGLVTLWGHSVALSGGHNP